MRNVRDTKAEMQKSRFLRYLEPSFLIFCTDAILAVDATVSLMRLVDTFVVPGLPCGLSGFCVVCEFRRREEVTTSEVETAKLSISLRVTDPKMNQVPLGEWQIQPHGQPWAVHRLIINLSGQLVLMHEGNYVFEVLGKTANSTYQKVAERTIEARVVEGSPGMLLRHGQPQGESSSQAVKK